MSYGFNYVFNMLARQNGSNFAGVQAFAQKQKPGILNNLEERMASQLFGASSNVSIKFGGFRIGSSSTASPTVPQELFANIAGEIDASETLINNLNPGSVNEELSQVRFLFGLTKALAEVQQATYDGATITNESKGFLGLFGTDSEYLRNQTFEVFDSLVNDGQALELAIQDISDEALKTELLAIQDELAALQTATLSGDADEAVTLANEAIDLLPESTNDFFENIDTTTLDQTSENLLEFGFGVSRALADFAQGELNQANPNSALLEQVDHLFEILNVGNGNFNEEIISRTADSTLADDLETERLVLAGLDINELGDLSSVRASLDNVFTTFTNSSNTSAPLLVEQDNPGGIELEGVETLLDIQDAVEQNIQDIQDLIDNSGVTDSGVLSALQDVVRELETIDFDGNAQDALDVLASARDLLTTAQNESEANGASAGTFIEERDFGSPVVAALNSAANRILSEGQAAAETEATALQLQASMLEEIFRATSGLAGRTYLLLGIEDDNFVRTPVNSQPIQEI